MAKVHDVKSIEEFNKLLEDAPATNLIALNFHAPWAAPCTQMNQVFSELAKQSDPATTLFISVDAEEYPDISESYEVTAVPYFVLLKNRIIVSKVSGADPTELSNAVATHSGTGAASSFKLPPVQTTSAPPATTTEGSNGTEEPEEEDLNTRLGKLVKAAPVMLFMKGTPAAPQCGFSRQLVGLLREREVRYGFFNILADDEVRQGLKTFSDWPTFPQLYVGGNLIGGLDIVKEEFEANPDFIKELTAGDAVA